ncbi:hypothetical protein BDR06DRAFT_1020526 [Suillus hirtellus]|nr:hypothetical protein BDR06DRAFT_1020526 [Suillus hirtellus]
MLAQFASIKRAAGAAALFIYSCTLDNRTHLLLIWPSGKPTMSINGKNGLTFLRYVPRKYKNPRDFDVSTGGHLLDYNYAALVYLWDTCVLCRYCCCISLTRLGDKTNFFV